MKLGPESVAQINLVNWFTHNYPDLADDLYHFANERSCSIQQGRILKRMGVRAGVADLFLAFPMGRACGLWIELKEGNGKPTKAQREFISRMNSRGYCAVIVWGLDAAKEVFKSYLTGVDDELDRNKSVHLPIGSPIC